MKKFTTGLLTGVVLTSSITTFAASGRMIEVFDNVKKVVVNKVEKPFDKNNKPFVYNGTTYVPLRFVADALGENVDWDGKTGTVFIGETNNKNAHYWGEELKAVNESGCTYGYEGKGIKDNQGNSYANYLELRTPKGVNYPAYAEFALNGQYTTFKADLGIPEIGKDVNNADRILDIYVDGVKVATHKLNAGDLIRPISVDIKGANKIRFELNLIEKGGYLYSHYVGLFNGEFIK